MFKYIVLNGPPRSGKDTVKHMIGDRIRASDDNALTSIVTFSDILQTACYTLYAIPEAIWNERYLSVLKDAPWGMLFGKTQREVMIDLAENYMKDRYGEFVMVDLFIRRMAIAAPMLVKGEWSKVYILMDTGFQAEFDHFVKGVGAENVTLIYIDREGCDYSNDSRSTVTAPSGVDVHFIINNGSLEDLDNRVRFLLDVIL